MVTIWLGMNLMGLREKGGSEAYLFAPRGIYDFFRGSMSLRGFKQKAILPVASTFKGGREDLEAVPFDPVGRCYHIYENDRLTVKAAPIKHSIFCLGYVIQEKEVRGSFRVEKMQEMGILPGPIYKKFLTGEAVTLPDGRVVRPEDVMEPARRGRKIVILGDTCDPSGIAHLAMNADVLVHEATCSDDERTAAITYYHSTAGMAGSFAKHINAQNLILTHFSPRNFHSNEYDECIQVRTLVEQARRSFGKPTVYPAHVKVGPHIPISRAFRTFGDFPYLL